MRLLRDRDKRFRFKYDGDRIVDMKMSWDIERRPLWKTLSNLSPTIAIKWIDRFSPFEAVACEWAFAGALEKHHNIKVPPRAEHIRTIYLEIQRILWSLRYISNIFSALSDEIRFQQS